MIKIKNTATGEVLKVWHTANSNGRIIYGEKTMPTERFFNSYPYLSASGKNEEGYIVLALSEGYEVVTRASKKDTPAPKANSRKVSAKAPKAPKAAPMDTPEPEPMPTPEKAAVTITPAPEADGVTDALSVAFAPVFANVAANIESKIRASVQAEIEALRKQATAHVTKLEVTMPEGKTNEVEGVFCEEFADIVQDVSDGFMPYLWGAAGCGKTHTAEQVAKALGLEFFPQTTIQFAHDVRGYGDAAGNFVETPFYKAFVHGGLYFQDEYDRSLPEASIVLNTAIANRFYDFPVIGKVEAHPNFRFMAAGNTRMLGADEEYVSGQVQDASSRDRVVYYEMNYDRRVELPVIAHGDAELVDFVEDVRRAIKAAHISHVVSYRETAYMYARKDKKEKALTRSTFKGLEVDEMRIIYGGLTDTRNAWAKALKKVIEA